MDRTFYISLTKLRTPVFHLQGQAIVEADTYSRKVTIRTVEAY